MTCNCCLGIKLVNHKCLEKSLETNCPICCDFLFTSSLAVRGLPCGHYMHSACFQVSIMSICSFSSCFWVSVIIKLSHFFSYFPFWSRELNLSSFWKIISKHILISYHLIREANFIYFLNLLGIHLQSLYLSDLQQIFRRYGGKRILSLCCMHISDALSLLCYFHGYYVFSSLTLVLNALQ